MEPQPAIDDRTPVTLITGFLGSGKTSMLNRLLRDPAFAGTAVIINEFGQIGLDHELVSAVSENIVLLQSGCLCCSIRGDLIETLHDLLERRALSEIDNFDRVAIETTGLADPMPILHTLMTDQTLMAQFRLDGVVTAVDAAAGEDTLNSHREAVKQAAMADLLLLTKTDLASPADRQRIERRLRDINPGAPIIAVQDGKVDPALIFQIGALDLQSGDPVRLDLSGEQPATGDHTDDVQSASLILDLPLNPAIAELWLDTLTSLLGPELLRMKGFVNVEGSSGPLVIHGVQHILHPQVQLEAWPSQDHRTRVVVIARNAPAGLIEGRMALLKRIAAGGGSAPLAAPANTVSSGLLVASRPAWKP